MLQFFFEIGNYSDVINFGYDWEEIIFCFTAGSSSEILLVDNVSTGAGFFLLDYLDCSIINAPSSCSFVSSIEDWSNPITEDISVCLGETITYDVDQLEGALNYFWYIDGGIVGQTDFPSFDTDWTNLGQFELCVDVSGGCGIEVDDDPGPNCVTISVLPGSDAGFIIAETSPECPGGIMYISVNGFSTNPGDEHHLIFTDEFGEVILSFPYSGLYEFTWPTCQAITIYSLNFQSMGPTEVPIVGDIYFGSSCDGYCCDESEILVEFQDNDPPVFIGLPDNITVSCYQLLDEMGLYLLEDLEVVDDCIDNQVIVGEETIDIDMCLGGTIIREWEVEDACGNQAYYQQTITVNPFPQPEFLGVPPNMTMSNSEYESWNIPWLTYDNGFSNSCGIYGDIFPEIEDNRNGCEGTIILSYFFTDPCLNTIALDVEIEITSDAMAQDTFINFCDQNGTGEVELIMQELDLLFSFDPTSNTTYFATAADLNQEVNPLSFPVNTLDLPTSFIYGLLTDDMGCSASFSINIIVEPLPVLLLETQDESCLDYSNGEINIITPTDFISNSLVMNSDTILTNMITNLDPGVYAFSLTDASGCMSTETIDIGEGLEINFLYVDFLCDDNETTTDISDDFYFLNLEVTGGTGNYSLFVDNNNQGSFAYDILVQISLPADGASIYIAATDEVNGCSVDYTSTSLTPCSSTCEIEINIEPVVCIDPGTPETNDDDLFEAVITASTTSSSTTFNISLTGETGTYGEPFTIMQNISGGDLNFELVDVDDPNCKETIIILAPEPCSSPCEVELVNLSVGDCDDNGTGMNNEDDFYFVDFTITNIEGGGLSFVLLDQESIEFGPYLYDTNISLGPLPANGEEITFALVDISNNVCSVSLIFDQSPCSSCNHILNLETDVYTLDCINSTSVIDAQSDSPILSFDWSGPNNFISTDPSVSVNMPGLYEIEVVYVDGCIDTEEILIVSASEFPISNAGDDQVLNCISSTVILDGSSSQYGPNVVLQWLDEEGIVISEETELLVDQAGTYGLLLIDTITSCISEVDSVNVETFFNEPIAIIYSDPGNILDCQVSSINLSFESQENTEYSWVINDEILDEEQLVILGSEDVTLIAIDTISGCQSDTSIVISDLSDYPEIAFGEINNLDCETNISCVEAYSPSTSVVDYEWYNSAGELISNDSEFYCIQEAGVYNLVLTDPENGCSNSEEFEIENPLIPNLVLPEIINIGINETTVINPEIDLNGSEITEVNWETEAVLSCYDCLNPTILEPVDNINITLTISTDEGCFISSSVLLLVTFENFPSIYIPNIFTVSSGDNFTIFSSDEINIIDELIIYDRWGNVVFVNNNFEPNNPQIGWDGTKQGKILEQGVYVYHLRYEFDGEHENKIGTITMLR